MPSDNLKNKLDGNQLDLSLSSLTTVPVKELSALPKATCLDMSCNLLTSLPADFCTLTQLVRLDLSKNQLTELPENFGCLQKLQHLDLYQNQLRVLPVSFCRLNALKWLDIKDNPLEDGTLVAAAGECLSDGQCKDCAKQVVTYMKKVQSDQERERQKRLKEQREIEAARKAQDERDAQRKKVEKKAEKEQRRQRLLQQALEQQQVADGVGRGEHDKLKQTEELSTDCMHKMECSRSGLSCVQILLAVVLLSVAVVCGLYIYCSTLSITNDDDTACQLCAFAVTALEHSRNYFNDLHSKF